MAVYAIGDLQGCYDPLQRLLDAVDFDPGKDTLWLTGDLVNRGPKSLRTLRFVKSLGSSAIAVLGNHDLHLLALSQDAVPVSGRFDSLAKTLQAPDIDELVDWLRDRPLAHYSEDMDTLLVHAGIHPAWTVRKALKRAAEVEAVLRGPKFATLLTKMYGNRPSYWSSDHKGYGRLRFIINCLTRMRMMTPDMQLNMRATGAPWRAGNKRVAWFDFDELCDGPRSQDDYIEIARSFQAIILSDVPVMDRMKEDQARRFIALVDEFYDRSVKILASAKTKPENLYQGDQLAFEFKRTISRLEEMRSHDYLQRPHKNS